LPVVFVSTVMYLLAPEIGLCCNLLVKPLKWCLYIMDILELENFFVIQSNLSIPDTLGLNKTALIKEVSLFHRFINTHLYCIGTDTACPDYTSVLILDCPQ
uniref:Uncharacterized protein n=1 Tax=Amphimedon queenslandica TaxID=400682 RepID=A0A1X7UIR0_AMPQE